MQTLKQQNKQTEFLVDELIKDQLWITLQKVRETLDSTVFIYPTDENKALIEKIDKVFTKHNIKHGNQTTISRIHNGCSFTSYR